ncbi:cytochrome-c peroxidase [Winogradskyella alexanderae]|uniref:Cytochrome-c peroxidase n=1 Tax=Winogradskyella alexanderae TaxID=2877123 RepID=A0ABS7XNS7_9FLAO|nr:cytochrome c peroxidase [Winogradskyella alexanderae]MCA0131159.1 cytochrome-c peroxidase [Winogradskyella alexanderae]
MTIVSALVSMSCSNDESNFSPTEQPLEIPEIFADNILSPIIPTDNPQTIEGVALGKKLFFDKILSANGTKSCASCHSQQNAFTDNTPTSTGIDGIAGNRNSMPLFNLAWNYSDRFNWDGKALSLERQAEEPVENPIELHSDWDNVVSRLQAHPEYPSLFEKAFNTSIISKELTTKAIAQFERTLISANSKFDNYFLGTATLTDQELNGLDIFLREDKGDCFHCHGSPNNPLWTDNEFHNNGLDSIFTDLGLGAVTGDPNDNAKFRTPSLRNLAFTAPYMHDGRFATLEEVIDFYSEGLQDSPTIDPLMKKVDEGGVQLTEEEKTDLKAFLLTLSDSSFLTNPVFQEQ